jgi:exopolysaccharide biosynthesis polyprenyl glycosylphosphotransferase
MAQPAAVLQHRRRGRNAPDVKHRDHGAALPFALRRLAVLVPAVGVTSIIVSTEAAILLLGALVLIYPFDPSAGVYWSRRASNARCLWAAIFAGIGVVCAVLTRLAQPILTPPVHPEALLWISLLLGIAIGLERLAQKVSQPGPVVIAAADDVAARVVQELSLAPPSNPFSDVSVFTVGNRSGAEQAVAAVRRSGAALLVIGDDADRSGIMNRLLDSGARGVRVVGIDQFYEYAFGRVPVDTLSPVWFMSVMHIYQRTYSRASKRAFDLLVAVPGLILTLPVVAISAVLVRASGPGPVLYRQTRIGEAGKEYQVLKLRTMVNDAEDSSGARWSVDDDPRVTSVGRFLRATRLDELPQLWNVLRGEMSIVGPRPERPEFLDRLEREVPFWTRRNLVKPGITGWAQLNIGYTSDAGGAAEKLSYDLYYIRHRGIGVDSVIAAETLQFMVAGALPRRSARSARVADPASATVHGDAHAWSRAGRRPTS